MTAVGPDVPVLTADDLAARWASLLGPLPPARRSLWFTWVCADGTSVPLVIPYDDLPPALDAWVAATALELASMVAEEAGPGTHAALALCRGGPAAPWPEESAWAATLARVATARCPGQAWSLHLVTGDAVTTLVPPPW
jgi:hypothetical protein